MTFRWTLRTAAMAALIFGGATIPASTRAADEKPPAEAPKPEAPKADAAIESTDKAGLEAAVGKQVTVTGKVEKAEWSKSGKVMNVAFAAESPLLLAVFEKAKDKVNEAFAGDAAKAWTGATVTVTGKLTKYGGKAKEYEGKLQIIVTDPKQVTVAEKKAEDAKPEEKKPEEEKK